MAGWQTTACGYSVYKALYFCAFIATGYNIVQGGLQMKLSMSTGWYYYITLKNSKIIYNVQKT